MIPCLIPSLAEAPPNKVIAHLSRRPGGVWPLDLRSLFLGGALLCSWLSSGGPMVLTKPCTILNPAEATPSRTYQGYNTPVTAPRGRLARQRAGTIFGWDSALDSPCAPRGPTQSLAHLRVSRRPHLAAPHQGYSTPVTAPLGLWPPDLRVLALEAALSALPRGHLEGPHKALPNSELR